MRLWKIAWRNIQHRSLASSLTAFSMALGVALVVAVLVIHSVIDKTFERGVQGYDLIVGPKGSSLSLVLNTVYYLDLDKARDKIPYDYYVQLVTGDYGPDVELAIPITLGGNHQGLPVVGTESSMFDKLEYAPGKGYLFAEGVNFKSGNYFEAVVGATAARSAGLRVGDSFSPIHGMDPTGDTHKGFNFEVVGILEYTGTPNDRALFVNIEGFFAMHEQGGTSAADVVEASRHDDEGEAAPATDEHEHEGEGEICTDPNCTHGHGREIAAVLVCIDPEQPGTMQALPKWITTELDAQAVQPTSEITRLMEGLVGQIQIVLVILAVLVVVVAGIGMMVSIYNSMSERRHEIAVMRALGARRSTVMGIILLESILLSLGGGLVGVILGHFLIGALGPSITKFSGVPVSAFHFQLVELVLIPGLIALASVVGYLPAVVAYRTDVAESLGE
jgi:putative ABC transport system permease protein